MADALTEILCLARLYLTDEETEHLVMWLANRGGRNQALAGDRGPLGRLEHIVRHWLSEEQRESLATWMLGQAARRDPLVPARPVGRPERRKG